MGGDMAGNSWNGDDFLGELTTRLSAALIARRDATALAGAVTACAAAAETICSGRLMSCSAGCAHCCVLNVAVLLPEAMAIADWVRGRLSPEELQDLQRRLESHRSWARWMEDEERIAKQMTCPFLDGTDNCTIHPVRPLACRGVASLDRNSCREALAPIITDEPRFVMTDLLRQAAYDNAFRALGQAVKASGLDDRSIELGCGVLAFLEGAECRELLLGGGKLPDALWRF